MQRAQGDNWLWAFLSFCLSVLLFNIFTKPAISRSAGKYLEVKVRSYIARYPVLWTVQSTLQFAPWQTCSFQRHLGFSGKHSSTLQLLREHYSFAYPPLSVTRYSLIQLTELLHVPRLTYVCILYRIYNIIYYRYDML